MRKRKGDQYIGKGELCCSEPNGPFGCTRDTGHKGRHVAVGGPRTADRYGYLNWPQSPKVETATRVSRKHRGAVPSEAPK
jgi:hypothetical protein